MAFSLPRYPVGFAGVVNVLLLHCLSCFWIWQLKAKIGCARQATIALEQIVTGTWENR